MGKKYHLLNSNRKGRSTQKVRSLGNRKSKGNFEVAKYNMNGSGLRFTGSVVKKEMKYGKPGSE